MKKLMAVIAALALGAGMGGTVFAEGPGGPEDYELINSQMSTESASTVDAGWFPGSGPVETGTVPGKAEKTRPSLIDTHYDPFNPDLRPIDKAGSTGG